MTEAMKRIMPIKRIGIFYSAIAMMSATACEQVFTSDRNGTEDTIVPIAFSIGRSGLDYSITTRAYSQSSLSSMCSDGIGVLGFNTLNEAFDRANPTGLVIENSKLTSPNGIDWEYTDSPIASWNLSSSDKYTFLAYHPYNAELEGTNLALTLPETIDECVDYLAATPVYDQTSKDGVTLNFSHILSRLSTNITMSKSFPRQKYILKSIEFTDVLDYPSFSLADNEFTGSVSCHSIISRETNFNNTCLENNGDKIMIDPVLISPYEYAKNGESMKVALSFDYIFTNSAGQETTNSFTREVSISKDFVRNMDYSLNVTFTPDEEGGIEIQVQLEDFKDGGEIDADIFQNPVELSKRGGANSYIVPEAGEYIFDATHKGNSTTEEVGDIATAEVIWESYGTTEAISKGDLISEVSFLGQAIAFKATDKKGNALIAAKDSDGNILWSWHIWLTDTPADQVYNNSAGIMMDRNLGATSASKADGVRTYGLLYQWGRKDPFLGAGSVGNTTKASSTGKWSKYSANKAVDMFAYAIENPTHYIKGSSYSNGNWSYESDDSRWHVSGKKSIHDPCPTGYKVPISGPSGFWAKAFNGNTTKPTFDGGYDFGASETNMFLTADKNCWYPAAGSLYYNTGDLDSVSEDGQYWAANVISWNSHGFSFSASSVNTYMSIPRSHAYSVRCVKE